MTVGEMYPTVICISYHGNWGMGWSMDRELGKQIQYAAIGGVEE